MYYYYFRRVRKKALGDDGLIVCTDIVLLPLTTFLQVNMDGYDYDAAASTIKIEDIATDENNRKILRNLKENDPNFDKLWVREVGIFRADYEYCPEGARDLGWVGYYIGKNATLRELNLKSEVFDNFSYDEIEPFFRGVNCNRSIQKIRFNYMDLSGGEIFQSLRHFFENNVYLSELVLCGCQVGPELLSMALRGCNNSLKTVRLDHNQMGYEVIEALSMHPQLEELGLFGMNIGRNECIALAALLRSTITRLQELTLFNINIDDEGVDALVSALANSRLRVLNLSQSNVTARGCQSLAALLENPNSNLETLSLAETNFGNEGARIFANALASNRKLKTLSLYRNGVTAEGWSSFSKVLCDTSSINNTFLSNHTLESLGIAAIAADVRTLLALNGSSNDKNQVAMKKILKRHQHFDMQPFFEWDVKVLPIAIKWFERAQSIENNEEIGINKRKLDAIYQFIRAMPEVFEPVPVTGVERN